ncbi:MAG: glycosyltransferase family 2 protein [Patescibacteria group bacterium]|nr:glycosyltransferase family 2 protein [Patescibacteria group bacterium]
MKLVVAFLCYQDSSVPYLSDFLSSLNLALAKLGPEPEILVLAGDNSGFNDRRNESIIKNFKINSKYQVEYIDFKTNLGFAAAYNRLLDKAIHKQAEYFLMLNPDIYLETQSINKLLQAVDSDKNLTAVCPKIYRWDFENKQFTNIIDSCGLRLKPGLRFYDLGQGELDCGQFDKAKIIGPSGAAAMFRLSQLKKIDTGAEIYDEKFFMYKEDCDLAYRLNINNLSTALVAEAICYHDRSAAKQGGVWHTWRAWQGRSRQTRSWSFVNQHLLFIKYRHLEPIYSRFLVFLQIGFYFLFSLLLAQFLLKDYYYIRKQSRSLD